MINHIFIFVETPFYLRDYDRYGIDIIRSNGFSVNVINFFPLLYSSEYVRTDAFDRINVEIIDIYKIEDLEFYLSRNLNNSIIYSTLFFSLETYSIYRIISKFSIPYCVTGLISVPIPSNLVEVRLLDRIINLNFNKILSRVVKIIPLSLQGINSAKFVDLVSNGTSIERPEVTNDTIIINSHTYDFDLYLKEQLTSSRIVEGEYLLFLDNYLPFHPDILTTKIKSPVTPDLYHNCLNNFFNYLENLTGKEVVVAAHPKSNYSVEFNPFNCRKHYKNVTPNLVKYSSLVISTFSTSINFAILWEKPLLFISTDELQSNFFYNKVIKSFSNSLGLGVLNISENLIITEEELYSIDLNLYKKYFYNYIKTMNSDNVISWHLKSELFKSINN